MAVTIRRALPAEAEAIWQMTLASFTPARDRLHPPSGVFRETVADVARDMDEGTIYVAIRAGAIVGAVRLRPAQDGDALYCGRLAVAPTAWRQGIGQALMQRAEQHAREEGYAAVVLGVRLELPENLRFFERLGYHVVGLESHAGHTAPTFARLRKAVAN